MTATTLPFSATGQFSKLFLDYVADAPALRPFYGPRPTPEGFDSQLALRQGFPAEKRQTLVAALTRQYADLPGAPDFSVLLQPNAFTVTSGHQLNLLTGPLYVVFKLVTIINLSRKLKARHPDHEFVPVYWMASEDHDFEEINHVRLGGRTHTWLTPQTGAVGRMHTRDLEKLFADLPEHLPLFRKAYAENATLAGAVRQYMHALFGQEGLVVLDADDAALKAQFREVMLDDAFSQAPHRLVLEQSARLEALGYKPQVSPREINFFYLKDDVRERIVTEGEGFHVLGTDWRFSATALRQEIEDHPERFSPNVILRPLYQEVILPNLGYVGGPGELAYWLQLRPVFEHYGVPFPVLLPRNFAMVITPATARRMAALGLEPEAVFADETTLRHRYVRTHTDKQLDISPEAAALQAALQQIGQKAGAIDPTLTQHVAAAQARFGHWTERLEKRLLRSEAQNQGTDVQHLHDLKTHLFPGGGLQERADNLLDFQLNDPAFLQKLLQTFDPFRLEFYWLMA